MGYAEDFLCVKQFDILYEACMDAGTAFENSDKEGILPNVNKAFDEMKRILTEKSGQSEAQLLSETGKFLSDLTKRNYQMYSTNTEIDADDPWTALKNRDSAVSAQEANNAFFALQEEVSKFAQYYVRGARPNSIEEAKTVVTDGFHLNRRDRNRSDEAFGIVFSAGMLLVGIVMLIIAAFGQHSELILTGLVFIVFAAILVGLRFVKK